MPPPQRVNVRDTMFSTCLICHRSLGANDVLETFPVGRRLAFDETTGRLWVVCKSCGHWNLSPIEERWEAIEMCERLYREARIKASTDNIGLTTLREGLDLIRIGKPLRPELSAWRYGPRIVARRKKAALFAAGGFVVSGISTLFAIGVAAGAVVLEAAVSRDMGLGEAGGEFLEQFTDRRDYERLVTTVTGEFGRHYALRKKHLRLVSLEPDGGSSGWRLSLHHDGGLLNLTGLQATMTAGQVLAHMNAKGASRSVVQQAALQISDAGDAQQFIRNAIALRDKRRRKGMLMHDASLDAFGLHYGERLAVEMAMHEDAEREALAGELGALELAWKEADEIGHISDRMFDK